LNCRLNKKKQKRGHSGRLKNHDSNGILPGVGANIKFKPWPGTGGAGPLSKLQEKNPMLGKGTAGGEEWKKLQFEPSSPILGRTKKKKRIVLKKD